MKHTYPTPVMEWLSHSHIKGWGELFSVQHHVAVPSGLDLLDGYYSDSMNSLKQTNGRPVDVIEDPAIQTYIDSIHALEGTGPVSIWGSVLHTGIDREMYFGWNEMNHDIRAAIGTLIMAKVPASSRPSFYQLQNREISS